MNIKYFYEFKGLDEVLNRVEILCNEAVTQKEITGAAHAFILEYPSSKKLECVQASGAELGIISESMFQFTGLHTEDMQGYQVRFYRSGTLFWIGWLDSELYSENLSDYPPYPVKFYSADFNILDRLKFTGSQDKKFTGVATLLQQLKRCFNKLDLPFSLLYIGCSTTPEGITLTVKETALHKLYIQSSNFYDEDEEAMTCRKVIEAIIEPFGLMMVQRDACIYIYDYNTIKTGGVMKCYNFDTLAYIGDTAVNTILGDLPEIGFTSDSSSFEYEEMINNVNITSSPYAPDKMLETSIKEDTLSEKWPTVEESAFKTDLYYKDKNIENVQGVGYVVYTEKQSGNTLIGAEMNYTPSPDTIKAIYRMKTKEELTGVWTDTKFWLNIKAKAFANTHLNPFEQDQEPEKDDKARAIKLYCNMYTVDGMGNKLLYFDNSQNDFYPFCWKECGTGGIFPQGKAILHFFNEDRVSPILNNWVSNSDFISGKTFLGKGCSVSLWGLGGVGPDFTHNQVCGTIVLEITNKCEINNPRLVNSPVFPANKVVNILLNDFSISIADDMMNDVESKDYEFKSYVNKKVKADYKEVKLYCISANEEKYPVGKGNILKATPLGYELQLSYTRAGQTDCLERLLMCTIHSNYTTKSRMISVDIRTTVNPMLRVMTYKGIIDSSGMLAAGCKINFNYATTNLTAYDFFPDTANLSSIPYED